MRLSGQFFAYLFFLKNICSIEKRKTSKKQLTKQKQVNIKQQKQYFFLSQKLHKRGKSCFTFFMLQKNCKKWS